MNIYEQSTGELRDAEGNLIGIGYSGNGRGLNNPEMQNAPMYGPIPQGLYEIGAASTHPKLGVLAMTLTPCEEQQTFGRSGFFIHGDNQAMNHSASEGCIILPHSARVAIARNKDRRLQVIA